MSIKTSNFDQYFESINNGNKKVGDLDKVPGKITSIQEYKSPKSGKKSLKLTISVNDGEVFTYLGFSNDKSVEITKARLVKLCIAAVGMEETKKIYEAAANDEDVDNEVDLILELGTKLNKKLKKSPVDVIVTRTKSEDGFWDCRWYIPENKNEDQKPESAPETGNADDFLKDIAQ